MGSKISKKLKSSIPYFAEKEEQEKQEKFRIITRAEWKARVPRWREDLMLPALSATTAYTQTAPCKSKVECIRAVQEIQNTHMDKDGLPDIEYSFIVGGDGSVFEGRGWQTLSNRRTTIRCIDPENPPPDKPRGTTEEEEKMSPDRRLYIAYIGEQETDEMKKAVGKLLQYGANYDLFDGGKMFSEEELKEMEALVREVEEYKGGEDKYLDDINEGVKR